MECNKDDAIRAKEVAETKMRSNDFEGAKKFALKAQNLYPELENINQMLCICNVQCSGHKTMVGSDKDWYGILQAEKFADEVAVKKQYRRLALVLHPDKNRFPGAEAAFKLICEANAFLSDPVKKSIYDNKVKTAVRMASVVPPPHQMNKHSQFSQQYGGRVKVSTAFNNLNEHQAKQTSFSVKHDKFWTVCPFCISKYQCERQYVGNTLSCPKCKKFFTGHEIGAQAVPLVSKQVPVNGQGFSASHAGFQWSACRQTAQPNVHTESLFKDEKVSEGGKVGGTSNGHANNRKTGTKNKRRRRGKLVVESSESYDSTDSDLEDGTVDKKSGDANDLNSGPSRRSARMRQKISYSEVDYDDNVFISSLKKSRHSEDKENDTLNDESGSRDLPNNADYSKSESKETRGKEASENESDSEMPAQYEDSEFCDFEKDRDVSCFAVNQLWACYDSLDGMPRFYAKLKKVCASPFKMTITWFEVDPADEEQEKWCNEGLPVGCGTFKLGGTESTTRLMFSHQVQYEKGKKRGSLVVQPRAGEVWAIYKDWDLSWSADPENHRVYKYEIVEVRSDFDDKVGSSVCYLAKLQGFVSLFQRSSMGSFMIRSNELYKFSHRIRSYETRGTEGKGIPVGCFELDPASLPLNHDDLHYPGK